MHASAMKPFTPLDVAPILACFLALVRFLIPIREVLAVRRGGNLGVGEPISYSQFIKTSHRSRLVSGMSGVRVKYVRTPVHLVRFANSWRVLLSVIERLIHHMPA